MLNHYLKKKSLLMQTNSSLPPSRNGHNGLPDDCFTGRGRLAAPFLCELEFIFFVIMCDHHVKNNNRLGQTVD